MRAELLLCTRVATTAIATVVAAAMTATMAAGAIIAPVHAAEIPADDASAGLGANPDETPTPNVRGWLELARVMPAGLLVRAKLDTGAKTTAIHADILRGPEGSEFPAQLDDAIVIDDSDADAAPGDADDGIADDEVVDTGEPDNRIVFALESRRGRRVVFEREVVRWVNIKSRSGGTSSRPVVIMEFCVGGVALSGEVGLTDRGDFNYPLLVGRTMLADANVFIDPRSTFTHESRCFDDGPHRND